MFLVDTFPSSFPYYLHQNSNFFFRFSFFPNEGNNIGWISNDAESQRIDRDRREKISDLKKAQIVLFIHETCTIDENFERSSGRSTVSCVQTQRFNE